VKPLRILLIYVEGPDNATFSYQRAWPRQFQCHQRFHCTAVNLLDRRWATLVRAEIAARLGRFDAIVLLHSVFSNACYLAGRMFDVIRQAPQPKAYFIGNEYKQMPEKMQFCDDLGVKLLVSQSHDARVHRLYRARLGCEVTGIPNTGLDETMFAPRVPTSSRPIDLGYRSVDGTAYLGHDERREIAEFFDANAARWGLTVDISLDARRRFAEPEWAAFLNRCKGQLGTEAGGDYFELTDATRIAVNAYVAEHPSASLHDIQQRFFRDHRDPIPMRIISGRNVEAAGTRTVQILFEGEYGGYFQPDEHYIPLKKDFSNAGEAIAKFRDEATSRRIAEQAYQVAVGELTYTRLIDRFHAAFAPLVGR
jgi:hypothetical protein